MSILEIIDFLNQKCIIDGMKKAGTYEPKKTIDCFILVIYSMRELMNAGHLIIPEVFDLRRILIFVPIRNCIASVRNISVIVKSLFRKELCVLFIC